MTGVRKTVEGRTVTLAKAGVHLVSCAHLDSRFRGNDGGAGAGMTAEQARE